MPATVIVGAQWGDEGKGKIVDLLAQHSDVVCRYNGGPNAGHTIKVEDEIYKLRHLPAGILSGKECVIGAGVHRRSPGRERAVGAARIIVVRRGATITREWPWNKGIVAGTIRLWNPPRQPT